ncbi:hypothetical protein HC891_03205 [Candidatus Gracilibacteria bacterium]|nr:hypothetical protein [Candidatus Gracilibacteria bacterium]
MATSTDVQKTFAAGVQAMNASTQAHQQVLGWNGRGEELVQLADGSLWIGARLLSSPLLRAALVAKQELDAFARAWDAQAAQQAVMCACDVEAATDDMDAYAAAWDAQAAALGHPSAEPWYDA